MNKITRKFLSVVIVIAMVAAMALTMSACGGSSTAKLPLTDGSTYGKGNTSFTLVVTDKDEVTTTVTIKTGKTTVGDALVELGIIEGEVQSYGLYVTTVNGQTLDWNTDQMYWAFYIDGGYADTGVDSTNITAGSTYSLVATAG